jgi:monofunctional biosynthetic peptidoglycan transglycosylase
LVDVATGMSIGAVADTRQSVADAIVDSPRVAPRPRRWRRRFRDAAEIGLVVIAFGTLVMWCSIPNTSKLADENPRSTAFIDLRRDTADADGKPFKLQWQWRPLGKISRYLRAAVVYAEDYRFYDHDGVDWEAIKKAFEKNRDSGESKIGGSTITQQLAKNLYLSPNRSYVRKVREMLIAFSLEDHLSKQRILELYLNVVEWGDGVFGAEAAAHKWFGSSAQSLTPAQAARLAIALPNPITRAPDVVDADLTKKAVRIIRLLRMQGLLDPAQERQALDDVGAPDEKVLQGAGQPTAGQPTAGQPTAGQPTAGQPSAGQPPAGQRGSDQPTAGQPDTGQPGTGQPGTGQPDTGQPGTGQPGTGQPGTGQPGTGQPDTGQPDN